MESSDSSVYIEALHGIFQGCSKTSFGKISVDDLPYLYEDLELRQNLSSAVTQKIKDLALEQVDFDQFYSAFLNALKELEINEAKEISLLPETSGRSNTDQSIVRQKARDRIQTILQGKTKLVEMRETVRSTSASLEEDLLREILQELGVYENDFISKSNLLTVCGYLGMSDVTEEELSLLFRTLDADKDSRISFTEFFQVLFHHDDVASIRDLDTNPLSILNNNRITFELLNSHRTRLKPASRGGDMINEEFFVDLDVCSDGHVDLAKLFQLWEKLGFTDGREILNTIFRATEMNRLSVKDLSVAFEHELQNLEESRVFGHIVIATVRFQLTNFRMKYEHVVQERDKLQSQLLDCTKRLDHLIAEADERYESLERSKQAELSLLQKTVSSLQKRQSQGEPDILLQQNNIIQSDGLRENEQLRLKLSSMEQDFHNVRSELLEVTNTCKLLQAEKVQLNKRVNDIPSLQQQISNLISSRDSSQQRCSELSDYIHSLEEKNKVLKDEADELHQRINDLMKTQRKLSRSAPTNGVILKSESDAQPQGKQQQQLERRQQEQQIVEPERERYERLVMTLKRGMSRELEDVQRVFRQEISRMESRHLEEVEVLRRKLRTEKEVTESLYTRFSPATSSSDRPAVSNIISPESANYYSNHTVKSDDITWNDKKYREDLRLQLNTLRLQLKEEHKLEMEQLKQNHSLEVEKLIRERFESERKLTKDHLEILYGTEDDAEILRRKVVRLQEELEREKELNRQLLEPSSVYDTTKQYSNRSIEAVEMTAVKENQSLKQNESAYRETIQSMEMKLHNAMEQLQDMSVALAQFTEERDELRSRLDNSVDKVYYQSMVTHLSELEALNRRLQDVLETRSVEAHRIIATTYKQYKGEAEGLLHRSEQLQLLLASMKFVIEEQVQQISHQNEQLKKNDIVIKDLYKENSNLLDTLQFAEKQRSVSNDKIRQLSEKCLALSRVVKNSADIVSL